MGDAPQTNQLYDRLRAAVLSLELAPGAGLSERKLEARFQASRTPVRAALSRLEAEGLVRREGRGWVVSPIDLDEIRSYAELRVAVESASARLATERASEEQIARLRDYLAAVHPDATGQADDEVVRAGGDFHVLLAQLSGNEAMVESVRGAMTRLARTRWLDVRTRDSREAAWREHHAIAEAVASRDAERAALLLSTHIRDTNDRLLGYLAAEYLAPGGRRSRPEASVVERSTGPHR